MNLHLGPHSKGRAVDVPNLDAEEVLIERNVGRSDLDEH